MNLDTLLGNGVKNRRKSKRYEPIEGVSLALGPYPEGVDKVDVIDIGVGGVAFKFSGNVAQLKKIKQMCIMRGNSLVLDRLHCRFIYDQSYENITGIKPRRVGAQFKWLPADKKHDLSQFIKNSSKSWFARVFG